MPTSDLGSTLNTVKGRPKGGPSLCFTDISELTITRRKFGKSWGYFNESGARIRNNAEVNRLNAIGLPPAYLNARFNPDREGHIQAIGTDARGRRQYRYHVEFRASQEAAKFALCSTFGASLPSLRKNLDVGLNSDPTSRDAVISAIVRILDTAYLRIGNEVYRKTNKSFGLTTLRNRHARVKGKALNLQYRGKGGIERTVRLNDRSLLRIVRRCQDLPGQHLFQYRNDSDAIRPVTSNDVNAYLRENMHEDFTAKHFRTWHASVIAFDHLQAGSTAKETLDAVSTALGNTPAIARKSYIHPQLLEADAGQLQKLRRPRATKYLSSAERGFLNWLVSQ